jgi:hypothetical protein
MTCIDSAINSVIAAKENAVKTQVGFAVAAKQLDATRQQGDAANQLLEAAAQLSKGLGFDAAA